MANVDIPIALRRTRRSTSQLSAAYGAANDTAIVLATPEKMGRSTTPATPLSQGRRQTRRQQKRVRFSDPGPAPLASASSPTGLTPMVRHTSLASPPGSHRGHRRHSAPAGPAASGEVVTFLPLRQVLDGRVKRRLRRNGLSEEMNTIFSERRRREAAAKVELDRLRAAVAAKDAEIEQLRAAASAAIECADDNDDTIFQDNERIMNLEREVAMLRRQLTGQADGHASHADITANWTMAARDPFASMTTADNDGYEDYNDSNDFNDHNDDLFGETTMAELMCSTPSRSGRKRKADAADIDDAYRMSRNSLPTPTSERSAAPSSPRSPTTFGMPRMHLFSTARVQLPSQADECANAVVPVTFPDPRTEQLQDEIASLQRETAKLRSALQTYQSLVARLDGKLDGVVNSVSTSSFSSALAEQDAAALLESKVILLLQALSDKTAALGDLSKSLAGLGFSGAGDASEVVISLVAAFRTARLELEYLTPGEITLPLTAPVAQVLDMLLDRLRSLEQQTRQADAQIDEYHEIEQSLRQQLGARVATMDGMANELADKDALLADKDACIANLEVGLDRLKGAMATYTRDVSELEALVQRLEVQLAAATSDADAKGAQASTLQSDLEARDAAHKSALVALETDLEAKLAATLAQANTLRGEIAALEGSLDAKLTAQREASSAETKTIEAKHAATLATLNQGHGRALALRDARVQELRDEIERVNSALRAAHNAVRQLRVDNAGLGAALDAEKQRARTAVATLQAELERVGRLGQELLAAVASEASTTETNPRKRMSVGAVAGRRRRLARRSSSSPEPLAGDGAEEQHAEETTQDQRASKKRRRYDSGLGFLDEEGLELAA